MLRALSTIRPALILVLLPAALAAQDNDPPGRVGRVSSILGTVSFQAAGLGDWSVAPLNYTVTSGDRILTNRRSRAELEVGPFDVRLADTTDLTVSTLDDQFAQLGLTQGTLRVSVYRLARGDSMEVDTPNGAMIIRSAGHYRIDVLPGVSTIVTVDDGAMELSGPGLSQTLRRAQSVELTGSNPIMASLVEKPRQTDFDAWSADRDRRQELSDCSRYVSRDIPGCADLSDNGSWVHHVEYGYVWRPMRVAVGWVPYRYGRWVWTGPWGWTWVEDSPWGFAPFHYGRWVVVGGVWAWAPGPIIRRPCYAPALVVFIGGPRYGRQHQAWFPLGWNEPYFPRYRHSDLYLRSVNIANVRHISNVDEFVDPRRADRIDYANRPATTVVSTEGFGRRPVNHDAANVRPDEIARAPIARERWQPATIATRPANIEPRVEERMVEPSVVPPTGEQRPLIYRNTPVARPRTEVQTPTQPGVPPSRSRPADVEPMAPRPIERSPLITRRDPPDDRPVITRRNDAPSRPTGSDIPDARRRGGLERATEPAPPRSSPRSEPSPPPREATRPRGPSGGAGGVAGRIATRSRPPG